MNGGLKLNIEVKNITKTYGDNIVLENISTSIYGGEIFCLLGRNGVGKSTFLNLIANLIKPDNGDICVDKKSIYDQSYFESIKGKIGYISQNDFLIDQLSGLQYLEFTCLLYGVPKEEISDRINDIVKWFFTDTSMLNRTIGNYSLGMRKKVSLCSVFIHKPTVLILDEPFANLDFYTSNQLVSLLQKYISVNRIIILSSHDVDLTQKIATRICVLKDHRVVLDQLKREIDNHNLGELLTSVEDNEKKGIHEISWIY